eukprot:15342811-Ditylum_brightwellii.AAC.1
MDYDADKFLDQDYTSERESDSDNHSNDDDDEEGDEIEQNELAGILYDDLPPLIAPGSDNDYDSESDSNDKDKDKNPFQQAN